MAERNLFLLSLYSIESWGVCCFLQVTQTAAQQHIFFFLSFLSWIIFNYIFPHSNSFQKELFKEQKMRSKVEESVARAAEDAQTQINTQVATNAKLERLLTALHEHFEATKQEAHSHIVSSEFLSCLDLNYYLF